MSGMDFSEEVRQSLKAQVKEGLRAFPPERIRAMTTAVKSPHFEAALAEARRRLHKESEDPGMYPTLVAREMATEMILSGWTPMEESR